MAVFKPDERSYKIKQDYKYIGDSSWEYSVWIEAPHEDIHLDYIEYVTYILDSTFKNPTRDVRDKGSKFLLTERTFGAFNIIAKIHLRSGQAINLEHRLQLEYPNERQYLSPTLQKHLSNSGVKRILSLDGGGIRGALTLGYLQRIEDILREQHGNSADFRLCDYFDLIGGTSMGSIIAACLAIGMKVDDVVKMYFDMGGKIFAKTYKWWKVFEIGDFIKGRYDSAPLENELRNIFGEIKLSSDKIRTGLCIITKRADTNSIWPIINHPGGRYYNSAEGRNKDILLWKALLASTASPTYFLPQIIDIGDGSTGAFVDASLSMANNPALQLLMVATLDAYPFHWNMGSENLLVVSVGSGITKQERIPQKISQNNLLTWATQIPDMLVQEANWHNQMILQWISSSATRWQIDSEVGDMHNDLLGRNLNNKSALSYLRYNTWLTVENISTLTNKLYTQKQIDELADMSNAGSRFELYAIGEREAEASIKETHFSGIFKL